MEKGTRFRIERQHAGYQQTSRNEKASPRCTEEACVRHSPGDGMSEQEIQNGIAKRKTEDPCGNIGTPTYAPPHLMAEAEIMAVGGRHGEHICGLLGQVPAASRSSAVLQDLCHHGNGDRKTQQFSFELPELRTECLAKLFRHPFQSRRERVIVCDTFLQVGPESRQILVIAS